jgi:dGTPase
MVAPISIRLRADRERSEESRLSPWAQRVGDSAGRAHAEPEHRFRTAFERDRARIIHSRAFRRLEYKTQVFLNGTGDHLRTRLTHTMEVASISRSLAAALGLNEDLTETIALAHDLGHPPFGHAGEETLDRLMADHGGFEHNRQSLRVVELIERKFSGFCGLNLSYEALEGLRKHDDGFARPAFSSHGVDHAAETFPQPSLEAQVANLADEIAYYSHDLDDGLDYHLITEAQLGDLALWRRCEAQVTSQQPRSTGRTARANIIRTLTDVMVEALAENTAARINAAAIDSADAVRRHDEPLARADEPMRQEMRELRAFLFAHLYHHPEVASANERGRSLLRSLFAHFLAHPSDIGSTYRERIDAEGLHRCTADYLAGMTDRYVVDVARRPRLA